MVMDLVMHSTQPPLELHLSPDSEILVLLHVNGLHCELHIEGQYWESCWPELSSLQPHNDLSSVSAYGSMFLLACLQELFSRKRCCVHEVDRRQCSHLA